MRALPRQTQRYVMKQRQDHSWSVVDIFTGEPVSHADLLMSHLDEKSAAEYLQILNDMDWRRRQERF